MGELCTGFWWGNLRERGHWGDPDVDGTRWAGHVACMGDGRAVHRVLVGKPEGKRPLGRPRRRWDNNIKIDLMCGWPAS